MNQKTIEKSSVATPHYVLMDGKNRIGPSVTRGPCANTCLAIYGFSGKLAYDRFQRNSKQKLTPYPLVKGYLSNQIAADNEADAKESSLKLVVLDAAGPDDPQLFAVTMQAVLDAQEDRIPQVTASHRLTFAPEHSTYQIAGAI